MRELCKSWRPSSVMANDGTMTGGDRASSGRSGSGWSGDGKTGMEWHVEARQVVTAVWWACQVGSSYGGKKFEGCHIYYIIEITDLTYSFTCRDGIGVRNKLIMINDFTTMFKKIYGHENILHARWQRLSTHTHKYEHTHRIINCQHYYVNMKTSQNQL